MEKEQMKKLIDVAAGRVEADLVIKNGKIINVFGGNIIEGDVAIADGIIAGIGQYKGKEEIDATNKYISPGFIDGHIHIESSYLTPEELGKMLVPKGSTTIIADPHEIANVHGILGVEYMIKASQNTALDIKFMLPSCVPATDFEHSGAVINAKEMEEIIANKEILGLGEFMNFPGVINADNKVLDKLYLAKENNKLVDGHAPNLTGKELNAYCCNRIVADHECATLEEMNEKISRGMYVFLRHGSACHELLKLIKGVNVNNSRRCILCSDDRQPKTIIEEGHIDNHLRLCVQAGVNPITAIQMATLNVAECFKLSDRGAIAPSYRADIVILEDLESFKATEVIISGKLCAKNGNYLLETKKEDITAVRNSMRVKEFSSEKLKLNLKSNKVNTIEIVPGTVVTKKSIDEITLKNGEFIYDDKKDILKIAVVERHNYLGNVACGFLKGYGLKRGAIALSIAHDSHNIIAIGREDKEIEFAVNKLIEQEGGIILTLDNKVLSAMPMPVAGLMSDKSGQWVDERLKDIHKIAHETLGVNSNVEPVMTLCFMSLAVIPEIKITDVGLFDVNKFAFIDVEAR